MTSRGRAGCRTRVSSWLMLQDKAAGHTPMCVVMCCVGVVSFLHTGNMVTAPDGVHLIGHLQLLSV